MQPADIGRPVSVSSPRVSPDGTRVAFVVTRVDLAANTYRSAVWLAHVDGSVPPFPVTSGEHTDGSPVWSPDGRRLAFTSRRGLDATESSLHVLPVDGPGETVRLCVRPEPIGAPAFSPDGTRIAFVSRERSRRWADGDDERARPPRRIDRLFSRLDGVGWTIDRPAGVFVVAAHGSTAPVQVADGPFDHSDPVSAPDGNSLVVSAGREDGWDLDGRTDLYAVDLTGGTTPRLITKDGFAYMSPAFDPAGSRVAALVTDPRVVPTHADVVVLDVESGARVAVPTERIDRQCAPFPGSRAPIWDGDERCSPSRTTAPPTSCGFRSTAGTPRSWSAAPGS
ncbi:TolB family protein [Pseudonocardia sp. CA-107938]|uniref:TolB family protein n=1 Tax=Pseudonocardia sp. CA-107938 TaxID=3240021 RepID=UPI003D8D3AFA